MSLIEVDDGSKICDVCGSLFPTSTLVCIKCIREKARK